MAKRQSHKQSRIGKYIEALMGMEMVVSDPVEKKKLREQIEDARQEWMDVGWERRFPHHDRNGNEIDKKQDKPHSEAGWLPVQR